MEELVLATCMATMLFVAMVCTIVFKKLKMPAIIGYLAAGIIIANYWGNYDDVNTKLIVGLLSELGLSLLMFSIGMELNFEKLKKNGAFALIVVLVQVPIALGFGLLLGSFMGWSFLLSITLGAMMSGSSTAVVLVVQRERKVLDSDGIDMLLLVLVVEDVAQVVLLSVLSPMYASASATMDVTGIVFLLLKIVLFMFISVFIGIRFIPRFIDWVGRNMSKEILIITALAFCFTLSALSVYAGMSTAVGAFLMGVIVSMCTSRHEVESSIETMKDMFMAMFFISIGLDVTPSAIIDNAGLMVIILLVFMASNTISIYLGFILGNKDSKYAFLSATSLLTMGEFAFIISSLAYKAGVMSDGVHAAVIGAALISMVTQTFITAGAGRFYDAVDSHLPSPIRRICMWLAALRQAMYRRMDEFSHIALRRTKRLLAFMYFHGFVIFVVAAVFYLYQENMIQLLFNAVGPMDIQTAAYIIGFIEFFALLLPCFVIANNVRSVLLMFTDPSANVEMDLESREKQYYDNINRVNSWATALLLDSVLVMVLPSRFEFLEKAEFCLIGIGVFAIIWILLYMHNKDAVKESE